MSERTKIQEFLIPYFNDELNKAIDDVADLKGNTATSYIELSIGYFGRHREKGNLSTTDYGRVITAFSNNKKDALK